MMYKYRTSSLDTRGCDGCDGRLRMEYSFSQKSDLLFQYSPTSTVRQEYVKKAPIPTDKWAPKDRYIIFSRSN
jgi:hypothetical protein